MAQARETLVAGGGIAGQTLALALAQRGLAVTLIEERELDETLGAGIQLSPNATHVLKALGLYAALSKTAQTSRVVRVRSHLSGIVAYEFPLGAMALERFGAPYWQVERASLMQTLASAVRKHPQITIRENTKVVDWVETPGGLGAKLASNEVVSADAVIAADGIHSKLATRLADGAEPEFTGQSAWRAQIPLANLQPEFSDDVTGLWTGPGAHVVHYPVGQKQLNLIACVETNDWQDPSWRTRGTKAALLKDFGGWHREILDLLDAASEPYRWALFDREPLTRYSDRNAIVIGDAAHPMLPFAAQGAAQAIEDAWVLAALLSANENTRSAYAAFEAERRPRIERVVIESRQRAQSYHQRSTTGKLKTLLGMVRSQSAEPGWCDPGYDWLYGYNAVKDCP